MDQSPTSTIHVGDVKPITAIHFRGTNLVPMSHTGIQQLTSSCHVGDLLTTFASHVEEK
jgi:hypothetical protein